MVDVRKLRARMVERGLTVASLSAELGIDPSSLYRHLRSADKITLGEAKRIQELLSLTDDEANRIFFAPDVASNANFQKG